MFEQYGHIGALAALMKKREQLSPFPPAQDRERWESLSAELREQLLAWGEEAQSGYPMLKATQFMAFARTGDRQVYEAPYFQRRKLLMGAVLAFCVEPGGASLDSVIDGLWCICEESTWVISAHNGSNHEGVPPASERLLADHQNPYIDLFAAQTAATLSYTLYLLGDSLDAVSPLIARRVRQELDRRIFVPFLTRDDFWWMGIIRKDINNWTPWILSNLLDSMLLVMGDEYRLAQGVGRALEMLDRYLNTLPSDGGCDEGCAYWNVAGASLLDCLDTLFLATGGVIQVYDRPLIQAIGRFPLHAHIDGPWFWNFADCDAKPHVDGESLCRYGERIGDEGLQALGQMLMENKKSVRPLDTPQMNRVLWGLFGHWDKKEAAVPPAYTALPELQVHAYRRGGWYGAIKGGHNAESHNHNDVGSFLLYLDGKPQIVDAGNLVYTALTFSPGRYTLWNTRSAYHNLPLIGGVEQREGAEHAAVMLEANDETVVMELAAAYPQEARLRSLVRQFSLSEAGLRLHDCLKLERAQSLSWVLMLANEPQATGTDGLLQTDDILIRFPQGMSYQIEEIPVTDARMRRNFDCLWRLSLQSGPQTDYEMTIEVIRR